MAPSKRGRACESCSKLKIKCELGSAPGTSPPCQRCVRLNKPCALVAARSAKGRMVELEAQVAHLTRLLEAQGIQDPQEADALPVADDLLPVSVLRSDPLSKKRRIDRMSGLDDAPSQPHHDPRPLIERIDDILSLQEQEMLLAQYSNRIFPHFPIVPLEEHDTLVFLRSEQPLVLLAICYASCLGTIANDRDDCIALLFLDELADQTSLETSLSNTALLAALQIACLWYRVPTKRSRASINNLIELGFQITSAPAAASQLASSGQPRSVMSQVLDSGTLSSRNLWRNSLVCFALMTAKNILTRDVRPPSWSSHNEGYLIALSYARPRRWSDVWLLIYARAERLCGRIISCLDLHDGTIVLDVTAPETQSKLNQCRQEILDWKLTLPKPLPPGPCLMFWQHVATAYLHETILHTASNRNSFTAPFVADRLAVTDFPAPAVVTSEHAVSLFELNEALHSIINMFTSFDTETLIALSGFFFTSRAAYALYLLAKLHIAVTAKGNTYGEVLDADAVQLESRLDQMHDARERLMQTCASESTSCRVFGMTTSLKAWLFNYNETSRASSSSWVTGQAGQLDQSEWMATTAPTDHKDGLVMSSLEMMPSNLGAYDFAAEAMLSAQLTVDPRLLSTRSD